MLLWASAFSKPAVLRCHRTVTFYPIGKRRFRFGKTHTLLSLGSCGVCKQTLTLQTLSFAFQSLAVLQAFSGYTPTTVICSCRVCKQTLTSLILSYANQNEKRRFRLCFASLLLPQNKTVPLPIDKYK